MKIRSVFGLLFLLIFSGAGNAVAQLQPVPAHSPDLTLPHEPNTIIIKTRQVLSGGKKSTLFSRTELRSLESKVSKIEPALPWVAESMRTGRINSHPLASIYKITITGEADIEAMLDKLNAEDDILYAEPYYLYRPLLIPNDPEVASQYHLELIKAYEAWNVEQGDSSITVAILDTGVDYMHDDLFQSVQLNYDDPVNGVDDDNDGLTDNYFGWDIANGDNVPLPDTDGHGTQVAGVSSAGTNNGKGIAGVGFHSKMLPIKIFTSNSNIFRNGYEAIALAADLGCQVINLSWGEAGAYSAFGEDVIRYAVLEKDVAIVAAGGNTNGNYDFYPASYPYVLSVGATGREDEKTSWGTFSPYMDLTAPGQGILTTFNDGVYANVSGTSLSSPMVAAAVALVRSRFPELNAIQAMEKVRVNTDDIRENQNGAGWTDFLGKGRLNMFDALTNITSPAIRISDFSYSNGIGEMAYYNDTISLDLEFTNYLYPSGQTTVNISTESPYVEFQNADPVLPGLQTLQSASKTVDFVLSADTPANQRILLKVTFESGAYTDVQYLELQTSDTWTTLNNGTVRFSIAGDGNLGYADNLLENGVGYEFMGQNIMENTGFLIRSGNLIADNIPVRQSQHSREQDFESNRLLRPYRNSVADQYYSSTIQTLPNESALPVSIEQKVFSWDSVGAVILEYFITNTGDSVLEEFQPAIYADFDLNESTQNRLLLSDDGKYQYTSDDQQMLFGGLEVLSSPASFLNAYDKRNLSGNAADIPAYLSDEVKLSLFESSKEQAGVQGAGNDVSGMAGHNPVNLPPGESVRFAVALTSAESREALENTHQQVRSLYAEFREKPPLGLIVRFCQGESAILNPPATLTRFYRDAEATDVLFEGDSYTLDPGSDQQVLFATDIRNNIRGDIYTIIAEPALLNADFEMSRDEVLLDENDSTLVVFSDKSNEASAWTWSFSNGYTSNRQNPAIHFTEPGEYTITLESTNEAGCSETVSKTINVVRRNPRPEAEIIEGCPGIDITINPSDADSIHVYQDPELETLLYRGNSFDIQSLTGDTTFYVTNLDGPFESLPADWTVDIKEVSADFDARPDTTQLSGTKFLSLTADDKQAMFISWEFDDGISPPLNLGNDPNAVVNYEDLASFTVQLQTVNQYGCIAQSVQTFTPAVSPAPVVSTVKVCVASDAVITPLESGTYHYYADPEMTRLIGKGRSFTLKKLQKDTVIYVAANTLLLESEVVPASVEISKLDASFSLPNSPFNLNSQAVIRLEDESAGDVSTRQWTVNGSDSSNEAAWEFMPSEEGEYSIGLTVTDETSCVSSTEQTILVVYITSRDDPAINQYLPYPNPAEFDIKLGGMARTMELLSPEGRILSQCMNCNSLSLEGVSAGSYLLRAEIGGKTATYHVIVK